MALSSQLPLFHLWWLEFTSDICIYIYPFSIDWDFIGFLVIFPRFEDVFNIILQLLDLIEITLVLKLFFSNFKLLKYLTRFVNISNFGWARMLMLLLALLFLFLFSQSLFFDFEWGVMNHVRFVHEHPVKIHWLFHLFFWWR